MGIAQLDRMREATKPQVFAREIFEAFVLTSGPLSGVGSALAIDGKGTLEDTVEHATFRTSHKGHFLIRVTDTLSGASLLKFYTVRKGKPVRRYSEYTTKLVSDTYAEHLCDLNPAALPPLTRDEWAFVEGEG